MFRNARLTCLLGALALAPLTHADVHVLFDLRDPAKTMFPSDLFTVVDGGQITARRVALPKPDCGLRSVECDDIDVLNGLDGFSVNPRVSIPFDGAIDPSTVTSDTVFLVSLGGRSSLGRRTGIDRVVWDSSSNTLFLKPAELLEQQTRYALVVTDGIRDPKGRRIDGPQFSRFGASLPAAKSAEFWRDVDEATRSIELGRRDRVVATTVFTTMSTTTRLERIRREVRRGAGGTLTFDVGAGTTRRAVIPVDSLVQMLVSRQIGINSPAVTPFMPLPFQALRTPAGGVGQIAFGKFTSPNFLATGQFVPSFGTRSGRPIIQSYDDVYFNLFVPAGPAPAKGWPVALYGHGFGSEKETGGLLVAAKLADQGIATMSINAVGHGGGSIGLIITNFSDREGVAVTAGGRGFDQDGDGLISTVEGTGTSAPRNLLDSVGALQQTAADIMQLVMEIEGGVDVDGDGNPDLDPARIYYFGQSFGGFLGSLLLATEPQIKAGVLNAAGGPLIEAARLSPDLRGRLVTPDLGLRNLLNLPPIDVPGTGLVPQFNENLPLRNQRPVVNEVPGAIEIQKFLDRREWATYVASPLSFAPYIRSPLPGNKPKPVIVQFAKGDRTVPNPASSALIRAGALVDRTSYYRNDLAVATDALTPRNPHLFLTGSGGAGLASAVAMQAQLQIATFFASDGKTVIDPDGRGRLFESPIAGSLPESLNFAP